MKRKRNRIRKQRKKSRSQRTPKRNVAATLAGGIFVTSIAMGPFLLKRYGNDLPMKVTKIEIEGNRVLERRDIRALAGLNEGDPLFGTWVSQALDSLKSNPRIEAVSVYRSVTGKVTIALSEKKPKALVYRDGFSYVDSTGAVLGEMNSESKDRFDYPVITGVEEQKENRDSRALIQEAVTLLESLNTSGISDREISELNHHPRLGWVVYRMESRTRIVVGKPPFGEKTDRLARVLKDFSRKERVLREIDLDFGERVVVKLTEAT